MALNFLLKIILFLILKPTFFSKTELKVLAFGSWGELCMGKHQMGLENKLDAAFHDFEPIEFIDFDKTPSETILKNTAHVLTIELKYNDTVPQIKVNFESSFAVKGTFRLGYLYFQWFKQAPKSLAYENLTFPAELHAIFYDVNAKNFRQALATNKSTIVLAFGMKVDPVQDHNFDVLQENLKYVRRHYDQTIIANHNLGYWLSSDMQQFYAYEGSVLELNCFATVIWIDFTDTLSITPEIVMEFKKLKANEVKPLMKEIKETLELKGKIFTNIALNMSAVRNKAVKSCNLELPDLIKKQMVFFVMYVLLLNWNSIY